MTVSHNCHDVTNVIIVQMECSGILMEYYVHVSSLSAGYGCFIPAATQPRSRACADIGRLVWLAPALVFICGADLVFL
jgi:hypothetical protein